MNHYKNKLKYHEFYIFSWEGVYKCMNYLNSNAFIYKVQFLASVI